MEEDEYIIQLLRKIKSKRKYREYQENTREFIYWISRQA